jgi:5-formyltetrahydrofolate cyclo-ligase
MRREKKNQFVFARIERRNASNNTKSWLDRQASSIVMNHESPTVKTLLRRELRLCRAQLGDEKRAVLSAQIAERVLLSLRQWTLLKRGARIALYLANAHEVNLDALIEKLQNQGVEVFAPHFEEAQRVFYALAPYGENIRDDVFSGFRMRVPSVYSGGVARSASEMDAILVPGLGFDVHGNRIGQGGGWYDRALADVHDALKVGIAFDFQISEALPCQAHDQKMDYVVTQHRTIKCG